MTDFDRPDSAVPDTVRALSRTIWTDSDVSGVNRAYSEGIVVRTPSGILRGRGGIARAVLQALGAFADLQQHSEDLLWCDTAQSTAIASHRLIATAVHPLDSEFGQGGGQTVRFRTVVDSHLRDGVIDDEWAIRDTGAVVRQLGQQPRDFAAAQIASEGGPLDAAHPFSLAADQRGPYIGRGNDDPWGQQVSRTLTHLMRADFSAVQRDYDPTCDLHYPGGQSGQLHATVERFWLGLRASFPSAVFRIDHCIGCEAHNRPPRVAIRFSLDGKHDGWGLFGAPSGAQVHVMGVSHAELGPAGIRREWVLFDEVAIWKQILLHTG